MPTLLAESATDFTAAQLGSAIGILLLLLTVIIAWRRVFGHEPPLHKEYITRSEVEKIEKTLKDDLTKQAGARKQMHEEIAEIQGDVKVLKTQGEAQTMQINQVQQAIQVNTTMTSATGATLQQMNLQLQQLNTHLLNQAKNKS